MKNSECRAAARKQLGGNIFANNWLLLLLCYLIQMVILSAGSGITFGIATLIITGPLLYGTLRLTVNLASTEDKQSVGTMFVGFKENFLQAFVLCFLSSIFLCLWTLLLIIPGIIKGYSYSMAFYIQQDAEDKNWNNCLKASMQMMKGHKWELFCLDFSFIGWYILGFITFGLGLLWVIPYHYQAKANFYLGLKNNPSEDTKKENTPNSSSIEG